MMQIFVILRYKNELRIDINEASSNRNTAYDWIDLAKSIPERIRNVIKTKLVENGGMSKTSCTMR